MPRVSSSNEAFKKVEQVVGRPAVTKDNINDLYVRDAPQVCVFCAFLASIWHAQILTPSSESL